MIYCEFSHDSDLFVLDGFGNDVVCQSCALRPRKAKMRHVILGSKRLMADHVAAHKYVGHKVPGNLLTKLLS